ncbi:hypothetical protein QEN19_001122 [Hanseniaspora menglaensis]
MTESEQEAIWLQDLERVTESDYLPQNRYFTRFLSKKMPEIPKDDSERKIVPNNMFKPMDFLFFTWVSSVLKVGYKRTIQPNDLMQLNEKQKVSNYYQEFEKHWKIVIEKHQNGEKLGNFALIMVLVKTFRWDFGLAIVYTILSNAASSCLPFISKRLIQFVEEKHYYHSLNPGKGVGYTFGTALIIFAFACLNSHAMFNGFVVGGFTRSVLQKAILIKSFKMSNEAKKDFPQAVVASMSTTDLNRIEMGVAFHAMLYAVPVTIAICLAQLIKNIGPVSLIGIAYFLFAIVLNVFAFAYVFKYRVAANKKTDKRIGLIREIANSLKIIKFYAWEDAYYDNITEKRKDEISQLGKLQTYIAVVLSYGILTPTVAAMIVFVCLQAIKGGLKSPANTFSSLAIFQVLSSVVFLIPQSLSSGMTAFVAFKRIQTFLLSQEIDPESTKVVPCDDVGNSIEVQNCSFEWGDETVEKADDDEPASKSSGKEENKNNKSKENEVKETIKSSFKGLQNISFNIKKGEFVVITGPIGCGKSSLLYALSRLMYKTSGELKTSGDLLLNAQPWIQNTTFKNNITFGTKFDKQRYEKVVDVCALSGDLDLLDSAENTEIGERGVTLSGGQKQRLALARTCYRDADIYLFDDVLSAVDAHVGKHIMDKCLLEYLNGKTRVLATHQLNLIEHADKVIFLNSNYSYSVGSVSELLNSSPDFKKLMDNFADKNGNKENSGNKISENLDQAVANGSLSDLKNEVESIESSFDEKEYELEREREERKKGRIMAKEQRAVNSIGLSVYNKYLVFGGGKRTWPFGVSVITFFQILNTFCTLFTTVWLSYWTELRFSKRTSAFYIGIYILLAFSSMITMFLSSATTFLFGLNASKTLHNAASKRILHVPMSYIDTTPVGTIINRFSKDIDLLDNEIPMNIYFTMNLFTSICGILIMAIIYLPWFAIAIPFLVIMFIMIIDIYQTTGREVKRLESVQRSFVVNNFQEAMSGLDTISMFKMEEMFIYKNDYTTNKQNEATIMYQGLQRWSSIWVMILAVMVTILICLMCVCGVFSIGAAATGVLINYIIDLSTSLRIFLVQTTELENFMNSVERLTNYASEIEQEAAYKDDTTDPGSEWPQTPSIKFEGVSMRYRPSLPLILKNLSFEVQAGEKIGICGKTGCGKSSTVASLFRITEIEAGKIVIDGVDISTLGLSNLRKKISIIPQESVLFKTTIRGNLDPFNNYSDDELWDALVNSGAIELEELEKVKLQKMPEETETAHKFHLYRQVEEDGKNFSLGEKQLLGLSRAVVKKSKVLVLDEATSSVDYETDAKIQRKIKENFGKDTTILTIAHRLKTIIDYDKVLVLDAGEVKEFANPYTLFKQEDSIFRSLCIKAKIVDSDFNSLDK